jgi:hypothetical protein
MDRRRPDRLVHYRISDKQEQGREGDEDGFNFNNYGGNNSDGCNDSKCNTDNWSYHHYTRAHYDVDCSTGEDDGSNYEPSHDADHCELSDSHRPVG